MVKYHLLKPGIDVLTFYFSSITTENICFQFKTFDGHFVYGMNGEKYERYLLARAIEVTVIR